MRFLRALLCVLFAAPAVYAHDVTLTGTQSFASLDGSSLDHDGLANGVFTVNDGNLVVNGVVNCNDDGGGDGACAMTFAVSGNMTVNAGGALYAENRTGTGNGGAITLSVGGHLALNGTAIVSTASKSSTGASGGAIVLNVAGAVALGAGTTIDAGSANARAGDIAIAAGGLVAIDGNVLAGPSRTLLSTRLTDAALEGGTANQIGGRITIGSTTFAEPAVAVGATANVVTQGDALGAGPLSIEGCGIEIRGLVAALSRKDSAAVVSIRSGKALLIDGRDLGAAGSRMARVRADAPTGTAINKGVDLFAAGPVAIYGPGGTAFAVTSDPGVHDSKSYGGRVRVLSTGESVTVAGNAIDGGRSASGDTGGTIDIAAKGDVTLDTAVLRAFGDFSTSNANRGGGTITVRSYSGNVVWTNGLGEVRPVGSSSGLVPADQGAIVLTACGTIDTTGTSFPVMGTATSVFPETHTGVCTPAAPSLPAGVPPFVTCNTPPVVADVAASTNEDTAVTVHLSGTDADGDALTFSIVTAPAHGSLGPVVSTGATTADVVYTPALDYNGSDSFVFRANDGHGGTDDGVATITIAPVNDKPSFLIGPTVTAFEDSGAQTYASWVTAISPGPANEAAQGVTFTVTTDNAALFSVQPAVAPDGTLTFTPAPNAYGVANVTVVAHDDGGTANGGADTSAPQSSSITVTAVNDAPSFTPGGNQTGFEDGGPQSVAWATSISAGPNETQTLTFIVSNDDNALFAAQPAISPAGVLTYTPAPNANGTATVTVSLKDDGGTDNGGVDTSPSVTFTIAVAAVNDAPSFTGGGDVTVLEDSGAASQPWATNILAGPPDEAGQSVTFSILSDSNAALFSVAPSISAGGVLSFTPAPDANGNAALAIALSDDGGTANGGADVSATYNFTIHVAAVNDAPSFTPGGNVTVDEDSGAYSAPWASAISAGPANESGQALTFNVANSNHALFSAQPALSASGVLTFTPAPNANGLATVTVTLSDNGGTANGGVDTTAPVTFTITVNAVNDPPVAGNDVFSTFGNTELRVDLAPVATPYVLRTTASGKGVLDNDADPVEHDPLIVTGIVGCADTVAPFDCTLAGGSKLSMNANGTFSFVPGPGVTGASFQYTITDQPSAGTPATATGSVTINISEMIWYVNALAGAGNGTSAAPFNSFGLLNGAGGIGDVDGPGDIIFVHSSTVSGSIALEPNQKLIGQGVGLTVSGYPLVAAGTKPNIVGSGDAVSFATSVTSGVEIAGLSIATSSGSAIKIDSAAALSVSASIHDNVITAASANGIAVNAAATVGTTVNVNNTSITSAGNGFDVAGTGPAAVSYSNGTILSTAGSGIRLDGTASGGNLSVTALSNVTIDGNTSGDGIVVTGAKFDAVAGGALDTVSTGPLSIGASGNAVGGAGLVLTSVSGDLAIGSLSVFGGTAGVSVTGSGLFTGSAGMRITSGGGAISTATGLGLGVTNATIGAANFNLASISASGGTNGIALNNTGNAGGLVVAGTGGAGSGGTIQNTTGDGVSLRATASVSLASMNIQNTAFNGVAGSGVAGFSFTGGTISGTGTAAAGVSKESGIAFNEAVTFTESNVSGDVTISGSTISNARRSAIDIANYAGTVSNLTIANNTLTSSTAAASSLGHGIFVSAQGSASTTASVTNAAITGNSITNFPSGSGIFVVGGNSASPAAFTMGVPNTANAITISGNSIAGASAAVRMGGNAIAVAAAGCTGQANFVITNNGTAGNPLTNFAGIGISHFIAGTVNATATISGNVIVANNTAGASGIATQVDASCGVADAALSVVAITGNAVSATEGNGIRGIARASNGTLDLTLRNNSVGAPTTADRNGIRVDSGSSAGNVTLCLDIANNTSTGSGVSKGIGLRKQGTNSAVNKFGIVGMSATSSPGVEAFVDSQNPAGGGTDLISATSGFTNCSM